MVDGLEKRLAEAVTDEEAKAVLLAAAREAWPDDEGHNARYVMRSRALAILNGPSAGWIGVGVLMVPKGRPWWVGGPIIMYRGTEKEKPPCFRASVDRPYPYQPSPAPMADGAEAKRPDCALVLAVLKSKDHQHG